MATIASQLQSIQSKVSSAIEDANKIDSGNKAAGTRVRKVLSDVAKDCKSLRANITEAVNKMSK